MISTNKILQALPSADILIKLEPEELAGKLLLLLHGDTASNGSFHLASVHSFFFDLYQNHPEAYPSTHKHVIELALTEAWSWLEAQGLLIASDSTNGSSGWRILSRRAQKIENTQEFADFKVSRMLPRDILNPQIADKTWSSFIRGDYDGAVLQAMKGVEVAVRNASGFGNSLYGADLMRKAFHTKDGPLTDNHAEESERSALSALFSGAIGYYKNPQSHRDVDLNRSCCKF